MFKGLGEAEPIQFCNHWDALETALGEIPSAFPPKHRLQLLNMAREIQGCFF